MMEKARQIKLLVMDVDGVLTRGEVIYSDAGHEIKSFNIQDGLGIVIASQVGLMTAIVTGRESKIVERRAAEIGITHIRQGCLNKSVAMKALISELNLKPEEVAYIGDDINDIPAFRECGFRIAPANATPDLKSHADYITKKSGGEGAVREAVEMILDSQQKWAQAVEAYLQLTERKECPT